MLPASRLTAICAALVVIAAVHAAPPEFEAASIKPSQTARAGGEGSSWEHITVTPTGVSLINATLDVCIQWAYGVRSFQVSGADRLNQDRYDILTKTEKPVSREQLEVMLQTLLTNRFQLQLHRGTRSIPVFALTAPKRPPGLMTSTFDQPATLTIENDSFVFRHMTMSSFTQKLSQLAGFDRPVIDKTGINGIFDITLDDAARLTREDPASIFSSLERFGFRLESGKLPVEVLVVDRAEKPSAN